VELKFLFSFLKISFAVSLGLFVFTFLLLFRNTWLSRWPDKNLPSVYNLPYEEVKFLSRDRLQLAGWLILRDKNFSTVILCHGLGTNKSDLLGMARFIYEAGFNVFLFDFQGHGESQSRFTSFGYLEQRDLEAAMDYLAKRSDVENKNIGVFGLSMGGAVAIAVAAEDERIKAVISDSAYRNLYSSMVHHARIFYHLPGFPTNIFLRLSYFLRFGNDPRRVSPEDVIERISSRPVLLLNGERDNQTPPENARILFEKASQPKEIWIIPGAGHGEAYGVYWEEYQKKIVEFLKRNL
jgi:fermentation-respiration switch protein FrsA (DUF1100 family)